MTEEIDDALYIVSIDRDEGFLGQCLNVYLDGIAEEESALATTCQGGQAPERDHGPQEYIRTCKSHS